MSQKKRILFFAESVTLAHFARPFQLAKTLDTNVWDISFASDPRYCHLADLSGFNFFPINSISSKAFLHALAKGNPVYDEKTLDNYVREDLETIETARPDIIVGDFRLSLAVSAPTKKIPYLSISNIYWSPYTVQHFPVPELPLVKLVGVAVAQMLFNVARPIAFALHSQPLNRLRKRHGLTTLGSDLRQSYTWADHTLYADVAELATYRNLPSNHHFIGPIQWSPHVAPPTWWTALPRDKPIVYVTLGSSGQSRALEAALRALSVMPVTVIAATAGLARVSDTFKNVYSADYLPGDECAKLADIVISNGGSPTTYQGLAHGKPVIGIASNLDQFLNMSLVDRAGAGILIRAGRATDSAIRNAVTKLIHEAHPRQRAGEIQQIINSYDVGERFRDVVNLAG